jgi:hypothetical protein
MFTVDFNTVSFMLAVISIMVGFFAVWQSREYKKDSSELNDETRQMLADIKVHSTVISQYAIPELKAYGESVRKLIFEERSSKSQPAIGVPEISAEQQKNISKDLKDEIAFLTKYSGKAVAMDLVERLKHKYDFNTIMNEIIILNRKEEISWAEAPNPPNALSEMTLKSNG